MCFVTVTVFETLPGISAEIYFANVICKHKALIVWGEDIILLP